MVKCIVENHRRPPRLEGVFPDIAPIYFVTFNAYKRKPFLMHNEIHAAFLSYCAKASEHSVTVGRYVIMPSHVHLFVLMPRHGLSLAQWIRQLRVAMGKAMTPLGIPQPLWQQGFFDHLLRKADSYAEKWEYVRQNPVRAGLVKRVEDWPYQGEISENTNIVCARVAALLRSAQIRNMCSRASAKRADLIRTVHRTVATPSGRIPPASRPAQEKIRNIFPPATGVPCGETPF